MYFINKTANGIELIIFKTDDVVMGIPDDPGNADYQQYLKWLAEGNTPELWQPE